MRGTPSGWAARRTRSSATTSPRAGSSTSTREHPTATAFPDGEASFLLRSADANAEEFERHGSGDGQAWRDTLAEFFPNADLAFGVLGTELWGSAGLAFGFKALRRIGRDGLASFTGDLLLSSRDWLERTFASERVHGLLAPWVLHTGLGPDAATSGFMTQVIAVAVQEGGMPVPRGGGARLADALVRLIRDHGGVCETGKDVERVLVHMGRAVGVRLAGGETVTAERAVIAGVTPTQLYERLVAEADVPAKVREGARRFRYGRAEMQIHYALSEPPRWEGDARLGRTAIVHVTPGLDGVSRAVNEAERGLLPAEATIVVRPAAHGRRQPGAPRGRGSSGSSSRSCRACRRATPPGSSTSATARGTTTCASATPTASRRGWRGTSRTSSRRSSSASRSVRTTSSA